MRSLFAAAAVAAMLSSPARSNDMPPMNMGQCITVLQGLRALSGRHDVIVKEDGKDRVAQVPWKFDGATLLTIGLDIGALQVAETAVQHARQDLIVQFAEKDGKDPQPGTALYNGFIRKLQEVMDAPCSVRPTRLKAAELKLGPGSNENAIPADIIGAIAPLLEKE
jgi:hypothetical protein